QSVESIVFVGLIAGLAISPFWLGSNRPIAWTFNAIYFSLLAVAYEAARIASRRPHPIAPRTIAFAALGFLLVLAWIWLQTVSFLPGTWHYPIWAMASDALGVTLPGSVSVAPDF